MKQTRIYMNTFNSFGRSLIVTGLMLSSCSGDGILDPCGEEKEVIVTLKAEDIRASNDSLPGYVYYSYRTTYSSTRFSFQFNKVEGICLKKPVHFSFEASCHQVQFEGDVSIEGITGADGGSYGIDMGFVAETADEIRFTADTVLELGTIDFFGEEPFFYSGVIFDVRTGGTEKDDLAYLRKVFNQMKVTATYYALRK